MSKPLSEPSADFPDAVLVVNSRGQIIRANAEAQVLFGFEDQEIDGRSVRTLFPGQPLSLSGGHSGQGGQACRFLELVGSRRGSIQFTALVSVMPARIGNVAVVIMNIRESSESPRIESAVSRGLEILLSEDMHHQFLLRHLVRAREEERARIAADIHDDVIQMMSAANLRLQQLWLRVHEPVARQILGTLQDILGQTLSHLREIIYDLRPPGLEEGGLEAALWAYLEQMHSDTGIEYRLVDSLGSLVPDGRALLVYRTAREALANVRQHAWASTVRVELLEIEDGCLVRIADDGVGYDPADVEDRPGHLGMALIRERAELAGGWCRIESSPGSGTTVEFWIPFEESATESGRELAG